LTKSEEIGSELNLGEGRQEQAMTRARTLIVVALALSALQVFPGCASEQTKTVQSTTTAGTPSQPQGTTTTTTETTKSNEPDSVLGATTHAIGTVILLPFRVIGLIV
jgi:hypothetical protein